MKTLKIIIAVLVILISVFYSIGFFIKEVPYEAEVTVNLPLDSVFKVFNDPSKISEWIPEVKKFTIVKGDHITIGSIYELEIEQEGQTITIQETLLEFIPNQKVAFEVTADGMNKTNTFLFSGSENTTTIKGKYVAKGQTATLRSMFVFLKSYFKKIDQEFLDNFKKFAEK